VSDQVSERVLPRAALGAAAIDAAVILVFAVAGRQEHETGTTVGAVLGVAAPFLIGAAAGWLLVLTTRQPSLAWRAGVTVWAATVILGLAARRILWDRGITLSFVIVTAIVLGLLMFAWRALYVFTGGRQQVRSSAPPSKADR